jgi:isopropylmalate/homocitrate/citramalate synthase
MSDQIWTGDLNATARFNAQVGFYDTTLRDGEQTVGVVLDAEQKLEIARLIDGLGVERIEAGFPRVSESDWEACRLIAQAGLQAEIWGFSRALPADIEAVVELGMPASVIEAPISKGKLEAYGIAEDVIIDRITSTVRFAVDHDVKVAYFGVDSTRAEPDFYRRVYTEAIEAGASEVAIVDTLGIASPEAVTDLIGATQEMVGPGIPIHWHGHNDFGLATAGSIAAVRAGAKWIHGTINGMGERAGNANIPEVALALKALYAVDTNLRLDGVRAVSERVAEISGYLLEPFKPVVGDNLFRRESGAVAAQFHLPSAVEPYSSELVGAERSVVLGKKSGLASIRITCERLGIDASDEAQTELLASVKARGIEKHALVTDNEFIEMVKSLHDA